MRYRLYKIILLVCLTRLAIAKEPELPLCPTNMQYFPQNLPMHCRLPATIRPLSGKAMELLPLPPPGFPGPVPGPIPGMFPGAMPMPMPAIPQPPAQKLPVVVMPFYSPDTKNALNLQSRHKKHRFGFKRRPKHFYSSDEDSTDTDTSSDDSSDRSSDRGWWRKPRGSRRSNSHRSKKRRHQKNKDLLTPVLQYVTKDGYVIFEKHISKGEAKNWLGNKKADSNKEVQVNHEDNIDSKESRGDIADTKFIMRDEENSEVKTESSPRQVHQKKVLKRKIPKKHVAE